MTEAEYEAYVRYLFEERIDPHLPALRSRSGGHMMHVEDEVRWAFNKLSRADRAVRLVLSFDAADGDPYDTFTLEAIVRMMNDAEAGVRFHNSVAEQVGLLDVLDSDFGPLAAGLSPQFLPANEAEMLRSLGFRELADHLIGITYRVRAHEDLRETTSNDMRPSRAVQEAVERLDRAGDEHREMSQSKEPQKPNELPKKKRRRWFKGLGQVVQGAAMSLADLALAAGLLNLPVSLETQTWGSLVSATAGVGTMMSGLGDLRAE